jgi:outer membrane protein OmpA-like peptidoglycan-associated protein
MKLKTTGRLVMVAIVALLAVSQPLLGQDTSDLQFRTVAVHFPLGEKVELKLRGTTRYSQTKGSVDVEHKGGYTKVSLDIKELDAPNEKQYTTYVVWAVTPEGLTDNLGEYRPRKTRFPWPIPIIPGPWGGPMETTSRFRTFSIVITAEPHFLVESPSRKIVATNLPPEGKYTGLETEPVAVNFRGDIGLESVPWREEHVALAKDTAMPVELLQARRAMDIAKFLHVEKYAETEFKAAEEMMTKAEQAFQREQPDQVALLARQAIHRFEMARRLNQERREAQLQRQQQLELADVQHQLDLAEKDAVTAKAKLKEVTTEVEEKDRQLRQARLTADDLDARVKRLEAQLEEAIRAEHRATQQIAGADIRVKEAEARVAEAEQQLNQVRVSSIPAEEHRFKIRLAKLGDTRYDDQVFVLMLPNKDLFEQTDSGQMTTLSGQGRQKLDQVAESLLSYPDAFCGIEAHVDGRSDATTLRTQSETLATTVAAYLLSKGISGDRLRPVGMGNQVPLSQGRMAAGREINNRVELVFVSKTQRAGSPPTDSRSAIR